MHERYSTIDSLENALIDNSRRSAYERAFANYYANPGSRKDSGEHTFDQYLRYIIKSEDGETTSTPVWYDSEAETMTTIPTMEHGATAFLVTGDASRNKVQTMPGGGFSTVSIDLPLSWDSLMAAKNYPALSDLFLTSTDSTENTPVVSIPKDSKTAHTVTQRNFYQPNGQRIARPIRGLYIQQNYYSDGRTDAQKRMSR